jgi:hypothetical protein
MRRLIPAVANTKKKQCCQVFSGPANIWMCILNIHRVAAVAKPSGKIAGFHMTQPKLAAATLPAKAGTQSRAGGGTIFGTLTVACLWRILSKAGTGKIRVRELKTIVLFHPPAHTAEKCHNSKLTKKIVPNQNGQTTLVS